MKRRQFLSSSAAAVAASVTLSHWPARAFAQEQAPMVRLAMPPLLDTRTTGRLSLQTQSSSQTFLGGTATPTAGFNQDYLGPTIILKNDDLAAEVNNALKAPVSAHWHGLLAPGEHDGGPHLPSTPGESWQPQMHIAQDPATVWYHSHIHESTAEQVYFGLAGVIHVTDGDDDARGLPSVYGVDDLTLVLQDRRFDDAAAWFIIPP